MSLIGYLAAPQSTRQCLKVANQRLRMWNSTSVSRGVEKQCDCVPAGRHRLTAAPPSLSTRVNPDFPPPTQLFNSIKSNDSTIVLITMKLITANTAATL